VARAAEKDFAALAKKRMHRPAEKKKLRKPKFLIYARNKKGKTTFSLSGGVDRTLVLDPEGGTDEMLSANPHVWPIEAWPDMDDAYNFARYVNECQFDDCPDRGHSFDWVSVDGLTKMSNMSLKHVMKLQEERSLTRIPGMVQQRDYGKAGELMKDMLTQFHNLEQGVVFTAQERQIEAEDTEDDEEVEGEPSMYVPDLPKGARGAANAVVDVIGRLYVVRVQQGDKIVPQRRLWIGESVKYDTGYRSDYAAEHGPLPDMLKNPTIPKLQRLIRTGSAGTTKKAAKKSAKIKIGA
jgi:hypothetical protein